MHPHSSVSSCFYHAAHWSQHYPLPFATMEQHGHFISSVLSFIFSTITGRFSHTSLVHTRHFWLLKLTLFTVSMKHDIPHVGQWSKFFGTLSTIDSSGPFPTKYGQSTGLLDWIIHDMILRQEPYRDVGNDLVAGTISGKECH